MAGYVGFIARAATAPAMPWEVTIQHNIQHTLDGGMRDVTHFSELTDAQMSRESRTSESGRFGEEAP